MIDFVKITPENIKDKFHFDKDNLIFDVKSNSFKKDVYDPAGNHFISLACFMRYYNLANADRCYFVRHYRDITFISKEIIDDVLNRLRLPVEHKKYIRCKNEKLNVSQFTERYHAIRVSVYTALYRYGGNNVEDIYNLKLDTFLNKVGKERVPVISESGRYYNSIRDYREECEIRMGSPIINIFNYASKEEE